jgi:hypothetical protein
MLPEGDWNGPLAETSFATGVTDAGCVVAPVDGAHAARPIAASAKIHTWGRRAIVRGVPGSWPRMGRLSREFSAMSVPLSMDVFVRPMTEGCRGGLGGILAHHEVPAS